MLRVALLQLRPILAFGLLVAMSIAPLAARTRVAGSRETISIRMSEGTTLGFDISPDGRWIALDLLGQLWLIPATGGAAHAITDAVRDVAEDLDPSFSPDGRSLLFRGERNGCTGLWLLTLETRRLRQLTQLSNPDGYDGNAAWSPDGRAVAFTRFTPPDSANRRGRSAIVLLDVDSGLTHELSVAGLPSPNVSDPTWSSDGKQIAFVTRMANSLRGGRVWIVAPSGGHATGVTEETTQALAPSFSAADRSIAYFAPDASGRIQVWNQEISRTGTATGSPVRLTDHKDVTRTRIRRVPHQNAWLYSADGRLWKVSDSGGPATEIPFTANLSITRKRLTLPPARFPEPGRREFARGFMGVALSPDGKHIGMLALGKLWVIPLGRRPQAVTDVPFEATELAWSPDGAELAWSAGESNHEDVFATNVTTGTTRRVTALAGREAYPAYSADGRYLAFVQIQNDEGTLRVVDAHAANVSDPAQTRSLGSIGTNWTSPPQWSPQSDGFLICGAASVNHPTSGTFVLLSGERKTLKDFPDAPIFLRWTPQRSLVFVRHDRLWRARFDPAGTLSKPEALGTSPALYASTANDGAVLFVSEGGLRLRSPDGKEQRLGWPISYTPPVAAPTLIRNIRIIDGTGAPITSPRDILIVHGRIKQIAPSGTISAPGIQSLDAGGRVVIPGLIDLHAHTYRPDLLPNFVYFGVTTIRDQGSSMAPLVAYRDVIASGALSGPRVAYGGFQFYSDWPFDEEQGRGIEPEADADHIRRAVMLAHTFGAQHIKTRTFRRWDINARMISEAHRLGMRATGHCSHLLPLIAASMDAKEHIGLCEPRGNTYIYDDLIQLFRVAHVAVVPTIAYLDFAVRLNERPALLDDDVDLKPFLIDRENFGWMIELSASEREFWSRSAAQAREATAKLLRGGVILGTGTDIWQIPTGVHMELEQLVAAGLTPLQAIQAATGSAARILGAEKELGTIEEGKWADLVFLDGDPSSDIRNTRHIWNVLRDGQLVDRVKLKSSVSRTSHK